MFNFDGFESKRADGKFYLRFSEQLDWKILQIIIINQSHIIKREPV